MLNHVVSSEDFADRKILEKLFSAADEMRRQEKAGKLPQALAGRIFGLLFYEPSTRTRLSFETAILRLGGKVASVADATRASSVAKGESLEDTIRVIDDYVDCIVLRHPDAGSAALAASVSEVPIINAGDGTGEHPTQALLDLYTLQKEKGRIDGLKIAMAGDLLYGRTVHSLIKLFSLYSSVELFLISPPDLALPVEHLSELSKNQIKFTVLTRWDEVLPKLDVVYMTRIQKERFGNEAAYERFKDSFLFGVEQLQEISKDCIIMHPLPRVNEISPAVDADPRAAYFRQAKNGLYVRMALLKEILG